MKIAGMEPTQHAIARRFLAEEETVRRHVVVALSGAHAYGFPSPDSDLDLKAIHIDSTARMLGLTPTPTSASRMETVDGIVLDYSSNEVQPVLVGILQGNGNYIERVLGALIVKTSAEHDALVPLVRRSLSRKIHRHYRGFAQSQRKELEQTRTVKKILYVLRTTLTGAHALRTGEVVTDVTELCDRYDFGAVRELCAAKRAGEATPLSTELADRWAAEVDRALSFLDASHEASPLPEEAPNAAELEAWLVETRRALL